MVELSGRAPMLFAGDAIYTRQSQEKIIVSGFHFDPVASVASMRRLAALADEHEAELFFSPRRGIVPGMAEGATPTTPEVAALGGRA